MADVSFEGRLERMFAQPPRVADSDAFAARVEARLDREWSLRRSFIAVAGLVGGVVAVTQAVGAEMYGRLARAVGPIDLGLEGRSEWSWYEGLQTQTLLSGEMGWVLAGLAGLALTLAVARAAESL